MVRFVKLNEGTPQMIVIGPDTHKRNHTLVALDGQTGALRGQRQIAASDAGSLDALRFAAGLEADRVWAIEDCRHVSARLEAALIAAGERVIRVPAVMTSQTRKVAVKPGSPIRSTRSPSRWRSSATASRAFRWRSPTSTRWRSGCSAITATSSSASAPG